MTETPTLGFFADLIEHQADVLSDNAYILYDEIKISFREFFENACRIANGLSDLGAKPDEGVAILMENCPEYLYLYNGLPMAGMYTVPINIALKGEGLKYILEHSDVKYLVVDDFLYPKLTEIEAPFGLIEKVFIRRTRSISIPERTFALDDLLKGSPNRPSHKMRMGDISHLMYTSGTTGFPKGVVFRNRPGAVERLRLGVGRFLTSKDVLYTCLPFFHGSGLVLGAGYAMAAGIPLGLDKRFSASKFLDRVRHYQATVYNSLGAMMPILLKQPEKPDDADNPLRLVISAAGPGDLWERFEKRFGVTIWEGYTAIDSGGLFMGNYGTAPAGSVGKPRGISEWKLIDEDGQEVQQGAVGEFIHKVQNPKVVEYYKNPEAIQNKIRNNWVFSGDLFYADKDNNLYFVDRKTDSMRRRGENISSWEVENIVEKYPDVAECAAFGVKTDLGEDEVMIWTIPREEVELDLKKLIKFCAENMAYFMVPRYVDIVEEIPRTGTLRIKKNGMKRRGVTERTWDREKEMPELKLSKY